MKFYVLVFFVNLNTAVTSVFNLVNGHLFWLSIASLVLSSVLMGATIAAAYSQGHFEKENY